ncbi:MAG: c-type cytochrome [Flavobacteriales bacterium]|nr:c-type cytochrome [Flavobacteriales bacterium]
MKRISYKYILALIAIIFSQTKVWAQEVAVTTTQPSQGITMHDFVNMILIVLVALLFMLVVYQLILIRQQIKRLRREVIPGAANEPLQETSFFEEIKQKLSGLKPMEMEKDLIMQGHEYDGIQELSNEMPPWLRYFFLLTIGFGIVYFVYYTVLEIGDTQIEEYEKEMAAAQLLKEERMKLAANSIDENNAVLMLAEMDLLEGKRIYGENCATCHGELGGGGAGPNLTDEYWIHGGGIKNVFKTIKYGYIQKGMAPWQDKLTPLQIQKVSSYVLSLQGTNPPNALPPAGEKWVEGADVATDTTKQSTIASFDTLSAK